MKNFDKYFLRSSVLHHIAIMKKETHCDEVLSLVKEARILMLSIRFDMSRHAMFKIPFAPQRREQTYRELEVMLERLASVDTDTMQSRMSPERFIVFKARFLEFEHKVIDFVNLFHMRVLENPVSFERDKRKDIGEYHPSRFFC